MLSLRGTIEDMVEASANVILAGEGTSAGREALVRMTLLMTLLDRLDAGGGSWKGCDLIPEAIPLLAGPDLETDAPLQH
jgi:hypothetical protein